MIVHKSSAYKAYLDIYLTNKSRYVKEIFMEILKDEKEHTVKLNYIYIKVKSR